MNAPWWRAAPDSRQSTSTDTLLADDVDDSGDLLPPFYD